LVLVLLCAALLLLVVRPEASGSSLYQATATVVLPTRPLTTRLPSVTLAPTAVITPTAEPEPTAVPTPAATVRPTARRTDEPAPAVPTPAAPDTVVPTAVLPKAGLARSTVLVWALGAGVLVLLGVGLRRKGRS
jgi:hypothetical protein